MDTLISHLSSALAIIFTAMTLLIICAGIVFGIILGMLPGFGAAQALALAFPFTYHMSPEHAILFFLAIYYAAEYGGSIPAILIRTPGTPSSAIVAIDGYAMTQKGEANRALQISLISGVVGGIASAVLFILAGASLAQLGLKFGPSEMFAVGVFGLSIIGSFLGRYPAKAFLATGIGLLLATVGSSEFGGMRFTFNQAYLLDGIPLVVVVIAFLGFPEALRLMVDQRNASIVANDVEQDPARARGMPVRDWLKLTPSWVRGTLVGTAVGIAPGAGGAVAGLVAYNEERRWSKTPEKFGTGVDEAIAGVEAANNAMVAGAMVPSLVLGIPGSGSAAIVLGMLISKGVVPGPDLFTGQGAFIMTIFIGLIVGHLFMLVVGMIGAHGWGRIARVPPRLLGPFVMLLLLIGTYGYQTYFADVGMVVVLGTAGYFFEKMDIPLVPIVLAFVMGPIIENNLNRALTISNGSLSELFLRPITLVILTLAVLTAVYAFAGSSRRAAKRKGTA